MEQNILIDQVIDGRYRINSVLGQGGMGIVYKATHIILNKPMAIKILKSRILDDESIIQRFKQEAQAASQIGNQHIIDIIDFGTLFDGSTYFVMEFLDGVSLMTAIERSRFSSERAIHIAKQIARALGAAHEHGIIHRDMKPDNIQLVKRDEDEDFVKILDFGIAKIIGSKNRLTQDGRVFGTPHYMSPEQCAGTKVDHRTDIYAVGVILYEMFAGKPPFDADNFVGVMTKQLYEKPVHLHDFPALVNVSTELKSLIMKCIEKKAGNRYQSMHELLVNLESIELDLKLHIVTHTDIHTKSEKPVTTKTTRFDQSISEKSSSIMPLALGIALMLVVIVMAISLFY